MARLSFSEGHHWWVLTLWLTGLTLGLVTRVWTPHKVLPTVMSGEQGPCTANTHTVPADVEVLLEGPLSATDERLVKWVQDGGGGRLFTPSFLPYNITQDNVGGWKESIVWRFYSHMIKKYFGQKVGGFFVEVGALDGYVLSTTLHLEQDQAWSGLLIEPRPDIFQQLLHKHRKSHAANFCLSEKPYPHKTSFWMSPDYLKQSVAFSAVGSQLLEKVQPEQRETGSVITALCLPLLTLLRAMGRTHIDLFVLDVEGVEWGIVELFPFHEVTVDMLAVERKDKGAADKEAFIHMIESKGFTLASSLKEDFVFVRNNTNLVISV